MNRTVFLLLAALFLAGCSGTPSDEGRTDPTERIIQNAETEAVIVLAEPETEAETESPDPLGALREEQRYEEDGYIRSYLTGEMVPLSQGTRRPLAIMISNDKSALPHYGIANAGVIYEAPVEGHMNRYMALIEDYDGLSRVGSVRSCRTYYVYFANEFNAIYAHYGQSTFALPYLTYIDNINGIEGTGGTAYFRSSDRKAPHNAYASGEGILSAIEKLGYSSDYADSYEGHFVFVPIGTEAPMNGETLIDANRVTPGYPINKPWFEYDEDSGLYLRYQYGDAHMCDEGQLSVKNILIQYCSAGYYSSTEYRDIDLHSGGAGYYIANGKAEAVTWEKDGEWGVTRFFDSTGTEIVLNPGKTWVCICTTDTMGDAEFE